jgi:hypothetical protein
LAGAEGARRAERRVRGRQGPLRPSKREQIEHLSGQRQYPVIEFEDGSVSREQSKDMAVTVRAGRLFEKSRVGRSSPEAL